MKRTLLAVVVVWLAPFSASAITTPEVCLKATSTGPDAFAFEGQGSLLAEALADTHAQLARKLLLPRAASLPEAIAALADTELTCVIKGGTRLRVRAAFDTKALKSTLEGLASRERSTLDNLAFLAGQGDARAGARLAGLFSLQSHLHQPTRVSLQSLVDACRVVSGCARADVEAEARAASALEKGRGALEFMYAPQDDIARTLLTEVDAGLREKGLRVREPSVTNLTRQLKARCQSVTLPGVEGQNLRIIELVCEADALVGGERVATMRFLGRGQDVSNDDALIDARRRFAVDEFRFAGAP